VEEEGGAFRLYSYVEANHVVVLQASVGVEWMSDTGWPYLHVLNCDGRHSCESNSGWRGGEAMEGHVSYNRRRMICDSCG
jgi:hypothetical protein